MLTRRAEGTGVVVGPDTRAVLDRLHGAGIEVVDLFEQYRRAKQEQGDLDAGALYLVQDSHWLPAGMRLAAAAVARRLLELGWVPEGNTLYSEKPATVRRHGDVLQMLQVPQIECAVLPEEIVCRQVIRRDTQALYRDAPDAAVLVLGDSFLRIYEQDEPQGRASSPTSPASSNSRSPRSSATAGPPPWCVKSYTGGGPCSAASVW